MIDRTTHNSPVLDYWQNWALDMVEPHTDGHSLVVTRGHSLPVDQLRTIERYGRSNGLLQSGRFPEFVRDDLASKIDTSDGAIYRWQRLWSELLRLYSETNGVHGAKINPPFAAVCLYNYVNVAGVNKKGMVIDPSPHIVDIAVSPKDRPCPIDFSAKVDGVPDLALLVSILKTAQADIQKQARRGYRGPQIRNITPEPANGCGHVDLTKEG